MLAAGPMSVGDLAAQLPVTRPAVSQHLKVLKDAGLVTDRREGRWMYYTLNQDALAEISELVESMASAPSAAERRSGCC